MEELLANLTLSVSKYKRLGEDLDFNHLGTLNELLIKMTADLFFLENYRDSYARKYNSLMHGFIKNGESVSASEIKSTEQVPEMYMLRRIMTSGYKIADAIRTNISYLKQEQS